MRADGDGVVGLLLAGGLARRLSGGDKCLRPLGGSTILDIVIERARPQASRLLLNANGDPSRFSAFGLPVVSDAVGGFSGPLAGILTGLQWARANAPDCPWIASFATDTPFFPRDFVRCLVQAAAREGADLACAASGDRVHPVFGLWPVRLAGVLRHALEVEGIRKIDIWTARHRLAVVEFPAQLVDPFFNVNCLADLAEAERLLALVAQP